MQFYRRNDWREASEKPLNRHFMSAGSSADAAEIAQLRRMARLVPPRADFAFALADVRE